jgi:Helix-turn-helix domain./Probable transposase.
MLLVHKIALKPNQAQQTYFAKACGIARFAYHGALAEWERDYAAGGKPNEAALRRKLNAIKGEQFPWMLEVSKRAPQQAIKNLGSAFKHFFRRCKQGEKKKG